MVKLELIHILLIAAAALLAWVCQGKLAAERKIKRLKKENARLRDLTKSQDEALCKMSHINAELINDKGIVVPTVIISEGKGYVNKRI